MLSLKQKTVQFYLRAIGGLVVFLVLLIFLFHKEPTGFPLVPVGGYVGTISGLVEPTKTERTFYVERIPDSSSIVFVAFADRFEPQVVTSTRLEVKEANLIDPVTINFKERIVNVKLKDISTWSTEHLSKNWVTERTKTLRKVS